MLTSNIYREIEILKIKCISLKKSGGNVIKKKLALDDDNKE